MQSHALRTSALLGGLMIVLANRSLASEVIAEVLAAPEGDRPALVAAHIRENAKLTCELVFDVRLQITGRQQPYTYLTPEERPADFQWPDADVNHQVHFVTSAEKGFYRGDSITVAEPLKMVLYHLDGRGQIIQVTEDCRRGHCPLEFIDFCKIVGASPWGTAGDLQANTEELCHRISEMEWAEFRTDAELGDMIVLTQTFPGQNGGYRKWNYYFGEREQRLVHVGQDTESRGPAHNETDGKHISVGRQKWSFEYGKLAGGFVIPMRWQRRVSSEWLSLDGVPLRPPSILVENRYRITKCNVLDTFPERLTVIDVPSSARIVDACSKHKQLAISEEVAAAAGRWNYWLLIAGCLCLAIALGGFRYFLRKN